MGGRSGFVAGIAILVAFYPQSVAVGFLGVALMFASAVVFERNLRRMGKAGWHDLTRSLQKDRPEGASRPPGSRARSSTPGPGFRTRFRRDR